MKDMFLKRPVFFYFPVIDLLLVYMATCGVWRTPLQVQCVYISVTL